MKLRERTPFAERRLREGRFPRFAQRRLNFRGCGGEPNRKPRAYHSGDTGDIRFVIDTLARETDDRVGIAAYSLGGNALLKYLGEQGDAGRDSVFGAVAISVPFDLAAGADRIAEGLMGRAYTTYFIFRLRLRMK